MELSNPQFWSLLDRLVAGSKIIIDRPAGARHPRYPHMVYPLDYGYLDGTTAGDGSGIDIWVGSLPERSICGILCTADILKKDVEIKILAGCTEAEVKSILDFLNDSEYLKCMVVWRHAQSEET